MQFTRAIVRPPSPNFAAGLTSAVEGPPDIGRALEQHFEDAYEVEGRAADHLEHAGGRGLLQTRLFEFVREPLHARRCRLAAFWRS